MSETPTAAARAALTILALLAAFPAGAGAQFRGDEAEDRNWDYSPRYFFEVLSFRMPWRWERTWESRDDGYRIELGSVDTDEFWVRQEARLRRPLAEGIAIRFSFLGGLPLRPRPARREPRVPVPPDARGSRGLGGAVPRLGAAAPGRRGVGV